MTLLDQLPLWALVPAIFLLRIMDVTIGTMRVISVVQGRVAFSMLLGFGETLIWVTVIAQVLQHATNSPVLLLAYAGGFATGNAVGITIEKRLAMGTVIIRIVTGCREPRLDELFRTRSAHFYTFDGQDDDRPMRLVYVVLRRREAPALIAAAREIDPELYFAVDVTRETNAFLTGSAPRPSGWRAAMKTK